MRHIVDLLILLLFTSIWLVIATTLYFKKKKSLIFVFFFTIFSVYLYKVLDYTLFQFQSLLLLKLFIPNLMLNGLTVGESINLIPLVTLTSAYLKTSLLNVLMTVPFGFMLPFITNLRWRGVIMTGLLLSILIEILQLTTGLLANITFRVADINDVIFNTLGAAIGYGLFVVFVRLVRGTQRGKMPANSVVQYIVERPQVV